MTKTALAIAAALIAGSTFTSTADAGGIRVGFGFPLGSFVARPHQSYDAAPSYKARRHHNEAAAAARQAKRAAAKAEYAEAQQRARKAAKQAAVKQAAVKQATIKTANVESKSIKSDVVPAITVPATPVTQVVATAKTETETVRKVAIATEPDPALHTTVAVEAPKVEKTVEIEKVEVKSSTKETAKRVCRKFSAAIAGLIDVPCE